MAVAGVGKVVLAAAESVFTVGNYPVEARADNAVAAKDRALNEGQQAAFRSLLRRLVPVTAFARLKQLSTVRAGDLVFVSNIPTLSEWFSPNHNRSWLSIIPRRGPEFFVGVLKISIAPVFASMRPTSSAPMVRK